MDPLILVRLAGFLECLQVPATVVHVFHHTDRCSVGIDFATDEDLVIAAAGSAVKRKSFEGSTWVECNRVLEWGSVSMMGPHVAVSSVSDAVVN
jgi:hypothetical protein